MRTSCSCTRVLAPVASKSTIPMVDDVMEWIDLCSCVHPTASSLDLRPSTPPSGWLAHTLAPPPPLFSCLPDNLVFPAHATAPCSTPMTTTSRRHAHALAYISTALRQPYLSSLHLHLHRHHLIIIQKASTNLSRNRNRSTDIRSLDLGRDRPADRLDMDVSDRSVRLTIEAQPSDAAGTPGSLAGTPFEPQLSEDTPRRPSVAAADGDDDNNNNDNEASWSARGARVDDVMAAAGPERRLTLLALRLAVLEKAASGLGALGFIWATVVLLGGFAITLERVDFWCVTVILLVEGARIFSRSHELEWQHQATWSLASAGRSSARLVARSFRFVFRAGGCGTGKAAAAAGGGGAASSRRGGWTWTLPWSWTWSWSFLSGHVGRVFYWLQLASATACVALSGVRLARQDFGDAVDARTNRRSALDIFYGLALAEALLFLAEKAAWEWEVSHGRLLERVADECRLAGAPGLLAIRRFFYDAYSRCIEGSIFDGLRMDLVSFAEELIVGGSHDEQRIGVGILVNVSASPRLGDDALRRVGTSAAVVERLVEMLSWKGAAERGARASAALVVSKLASKKRNALRVAGVPGAIESVSSLLYAADEECNLLGLLVIKKLARDHDNCSKIGNARGLLDKIIDFSAIGGASHSPPSSPATGPAATLVVTPSRAKAVQRSLQVIKMLSETTGSTGKQLRREVSEIVFTVSNIRAVLQHAPAGHAGAGLRRLGAEVLTRLAMDADVRERIGCTGGVVNILLDMFLRPGASQEDDAARAEAGEALAMLALESPHNCERILKAGGGSSTVDRLVDALEDAAIGVGAGRILTNLCAYAGGGVWFPHLRRATRGAATALRGVAAVNRESKPLEVSLGLAAQLVRLMGPGELAHHLFRAGVSGEADLADRLVGVLATYACPSIRAPRIRRFAVELVIALLRAAGTSPATTADAMAAAGMAEALRRVAETTSELECFHVFSGSAGLSRHAVGLAALVDAALELMGAAAGNDGDGAEAELNRRVGVAYGQES
ncbi:hypothetical protein BAE44_0003704 [Dichanthelium oligosanthes]|uniref:Uncharacterized protein n=1 Tax=Dichanthelium oligosanthes TaxID=888268 RepID=A0A1E5WDF7_9POAL|nr:hypothetical protein BAE44_0003704 [Dichanthelium oligosanthes]